MPNQVASLRLTAERLQLHFEVEPELAPGEAARGTLAVIVRLWGVHAPNARALPGCEKSRKIAASLIEVAEFALDGEARACGEVELPRRALYGSRLVPGADEVGIAIRIVDRTARQRASVTPSSAFTWNGSGYLKPACINGPTSTFSRGITLAP